jgi:hypothetical protein
MMNLQLQPHEDLDHYFHQLDGMVSELNAHEDFVPPCGTIITVTLAGLPSEYWTYINHVKHTQEDLNLAMIQNGLQQEEVKIHESTTDKQEVALISNHKTSNKKDQGSKPKPGGAARSTPRATRTGVPSAGGLATMPLTAIIGSARSRSLKKPPTHPTLITRKPCMLRPPTTTRTHPGPSTPSWLK